MDDNEEAAWSNLMMTRLVCASWIFHQGRPNEQDWVPSRRQKTSGKNIGEWNKEDQGFMSSPLLPRRPIGLSNKKGRSGKMNLRNGYNKGNRELALLVDGAAAILSWENQRKK